MRAALDNLAVAHHQNAVGVADGAQAVRHDKACATGHELIECRLHLQLGAGIDARRRLVQQQNRRVGEHDARDAQQLFLTLAKRAAVLADDRIVAAWQLHDKLVRMRALGSFDNLLARGVGTAVGDVFREALNENNSILKNDISSTITTDVIHEMDFILEAKERRQEEHFRKLDMLIRRQQTARKESSKSGAIMKLKSIFT